LPNNWLKSYLPEGSWFRDYLDIWDVSEPPRAYVLFAAMAILGACIGREVWFDNDPHTLYPMLNTLLIGPSGIGKSTSIHMGLELMDFVPDVAKPGMIFDAATGERLHDDLSHKAQTMIIASELATLFTRQRYMEGLVPYVTRLLDYPNRIERRTKSSQLVTIERPAVTVIGGSTVEWLQEQLPDNATSGGFLARFLIVKEDHKYQRIPDPKLALGRAQRQDLERRKVAVMERFWQLVTHYRGEINYEDYDAADTYAQWYLTNTPAGGHLSPFSARAGEFVKRLSILLALSCLSGSISAEHLRCGIELYNYATRKLQEVVVPFSTNGKLQGKILDIIGGGDCSRPFIRRTMRNFTTSQETDKLIDSLVAASELVVLPDGNLKRAGK